MSRVSDTASRRFDTASSVSEHASSGRAPGAVTAEPGRDPAAAALPSPMADLPPGTAFGTLVHGVLEVADLTGARPRDRAAAPRRARALPPPAPGVDAEALAEALAPVAAHPARSAGRRRRPGRRSAPPTGSPSSTSSCPLAGGDRPRATARLGRIAAAAAPPPARRRPARGYPDLLDAPALADQPLRGYLTGSIDAVLRIRRPASRATSSSTTRPTGSARRRAADRGGTTARGDWPRR